jgi:hypothetical protein
MVITLLVIILDQAIFSNSQQSQFLSLIHAYIERAFSNTTNNIMTIEVVNDLTVGYLQRPRRVDLI